MRVSSIYFAWTMLMSLGCGAATPAADHGGDRSTGEEAVGVTGFLRVEVFRRVADGEDERLRSGVTMHSGERFYAVAESSEPIYLYVAYVDPNGQASLLIPNRGGDMRIQPPERRRVPETGESMRLDDVTGEEILYFVGSRRPLGELADDTTDLLDAVRNAGRLPEAPAGKQGRPSTCPESSGEGVVILVEAAGGCIDRRRVRLRGVVVESDEGMDAPRPDEEGVAVVPFTIRHVP